MRQKVFIAGGLGAWCLAWLLVSLLLAPLAVTAARPPEFRVLRPGLELAFLSAAASVRAGSDRVAVLRVDPRRLHLRVLAAPRGQEGHNAGEWLRRSGALAVINAGQYMPDGTYIGLLIQDGRVRGHLAGQPEGLFLADPEDTSLPLARVLDLRYSAFDPEHSPYRQAAQSIMLLDRFGQIRVRRSAKVAHRSAVAEDDHGRILFMVTEGGHTLWELASFLKTTGLGLREVMCMDGGQEAQMVVQVGGFHYHQYGGPTGSPEFPLPWPAPALPAVLAVFAP